ncbi:hypothetical protein Saso_61020 [Streptomyces asoensis]|uniref:DUF397 domain-containing protein n=1 Tax=Streptomyces asoensis TaxID=249586 RepID=A0ABQ3S8I8_9ACTN|nr:hypothetical protein GCM10010496_53850 [Streptomyces asoensis]GHI64452.1 hypothetical protein Saso_61020 [Streptomyces asoensis]
MGTEPESASGFGAGASEEDGLCVAAGPAAVGSRWALPLPDSQATAAAMVSRTVTTRATMAMRRLADQPTP